MKVNSRLTRAGWFAAKTTWHRWFAWRPVEVGKNDCRWLETVERKGELIGVFHPHFIWEYRAPTKDTQQ